MTLIQISVNEAMELQKFLKKERWTFIYWHLQEGLLFLRCASHLRKDYPFLLRFITFSSHGCESFLRITITHSHGIDFYWRWSGRIAYHSARVTRFRDCPSFLQSQLSKESSKWQRGSIEGSLLWCFVRARGFGPWHVLGHGMIWAMAWFEESNRSM